MSRILKVSFFLFLFSILLSCTNVTDLTDSDCYSSFVSELEKKFNAEVALYKEPVRSVNYYTVDLNYNVLEHDELPKDLLGISKSISEKFVSKICNEENRIVKITITHALVDITGGKEFKSTGVEESVYFEFLYEDDVRYSKE